MGLLQQITDRYNRTARLLPAALAVLPLFVLAVTAIPVVVTVWTKVAALTAFCLPFAASQVVRDRGLRIEPQLFLTWGGRPSENMLRWRAASTKSAVARRHQLVATHLGITLPDQTTEAADPAEADELYATATAALRERTRDRSRFPLVFEENIAYGFRRNAYACRLSAILICGLAALVTMALAWLSLVPLGWKQQAGLISFDALAAIGWWRLCTQAAVRRAAEKYAGQLFLSLETLNTEPQRTQPEPA
ncbi:hypothetical protein ONA70_25830 [Micromonospora yasonensis]|uniref:hypothetical protein n=1 Tax=Micromonospora yasonensis TaxID=1128667 RepID=UPI002231CE7B|nr:hypothetical protein [Micromonospora yasonensis]MCW3843529.1 hypothetical protein [Micromonospora yasonensis]